MKNPKVSVVIPVYNGEKTLPQCLDSILKQNYRNYNIIVVDNASTDKTKKIIDIYQKNNKKIRYIFEKKRGRGSARNTGISASKGEIIVFTDSDCIVPDNWIRDITKPIREEKEQIVMGFEEDAIGNYWTENIQRANWNIIKINWYKPYVKHLDTKNFAIKASLMRELMFDSKLKALEDLDLYLRLKNTSKIRFMPEIKVKHYHKSSAINLIKMNIERGYWAVKVYQKHKKNKDAEKETMLQSISFTNLLILPFWLAFQALKRPKEFPFLLASELSWRIGLMKGVLK